MANSFPRPMVKRSASVAVANMIGNTASIYGSYMYPSSAGPQYVAGGAANSAICLLVGGLALVLRALHRRENTKLEEAERIRAADEEAVGRDDVRAAGFRYVY